MTTRVTIIDYEMGNLRSIANAFRSIGADVAIVTDASGAAGADRLVLPGVGAFGASMHNLARAGLDEAIHSHVGAGRPFLGICLGFQVLFERGTERGEHEGLGLFAGTVDRFQTTDLAIPHVGWNVIHPAVEHPLLAGVPDDAHAYFVHSFHPVDVDDEVVLTRTDYGESFPSAVAAGCAAGMQFHPEKSGPIGLKMLSNFLQWTPG